MPWWKCFECMNLRDVDDVRVLDFSHHLLHDVPPDVFQYERTLEELHLNANRIADLPRQLFYCQELKVLNLNDNELAALPPAISSLTSLQRLLLSKNALSGIVENIKGCKHLTVLDISLNGFIKLPEPVTSVVSLQELYLNDTSLEFLPANFGRLVNLRILELRDNNLSTLPKSLARLTQLQRLDIGSNEFTELPEVIGQLTNLTELWLDGNRVRRISANVGNLTKLVHFEASNNLLTHLPNEVANWTRLQELSISVNDFKQLPFSIGMMRALVALKADENNLQELPDSISQLENLEEIMVSHNDLFRLPASIGLLRRLRFLTADENLLRALPTELCSCTALTLLSVRGNKLTEVPLEIGHLRNLRVINIVNNFITHLPVSVLNLQQLSALWISDNQSQPLMPLQKDFGPEQSVRLTCFMLPQTAAASANGGKANGGGGMSMQDKERLDTLRHLSAKQMADLDEKAAMMSPSEHAAAAAAAAGVSKRRICFASDPVTATNDATARLMRSPTPYPKELRILAKYARYVHTNGQTEYVHVDDLRAAGGGGAGEPMLVGDPAATAGIELHDLGGAQSPTHAQTLVVVNGVPDGGQHQQQRLDGPPSNGAHEAHAANGAGDVYEEVANRYAGAAGVHHQLPLSFQPTMSPLLGDDELDARAAYFYATAEQKITTPVALQQQQQIVDYENVSLCSSSLNGGMLGGGGAGRPGMLQQQQSIYGGAADRPPAAMLLMNDGATVQQQQQQQPTPAERPASEVRMSQASSFGDGNSLSSAFGLNGMQTALATNGGSGGGGGTRSPAMHQQYYPYMDAVPEAHNGGLAAQRPAMVMMQPPHQNGTANGGAPGQLMLAASQAGHLDEDVVYYSASQGSESNYGPLPVGGGGGWLQQQQHLQNQQYHLQQQQQQQLQQHGVHQQLQQHLNNSDRVSLASEYARSELSTASGLAQQQQQPQQRQPPPYHIARAYTKKSKSDLMHYEHFRSTAHTNGGSLNGDAAPSPPSAGDADGRIGTPPMAMATATATNGYALQLQPMYATEPAVAAKEPPQPQYYASNGHAAATAGTVYANHEHSIYGSRTPQPQPQLLQSPDGAEHRQHQLQSPMRNGGGGGGAVDSNRNPEHGNNGFANGDAAAAAEEDDAAAAAVVANNSRHTSPPHAADTAAAAAATAAANAAASKSPWLFGLHKNPKVLQLSVPKTLDIGFQLTQPAGGGGAGGAGIFVGAVDANSIVNTLLRQHDKVLDMDGVDFTRIALADALTVLSNAGPVINVMVSRI